MNDMKNAIVDRLMDRKYVDDEKIIDNIKVNIEAEVFPEDYGVYEVDNLVKITVMYNNGDREVVTLKAYEFEDMMGI